MEQAPITFGALLLGFAYGMITTRAVNGVIPGSPNNLNIIKTKRVIFKQNKKKRRKRKISASNTSETANETPNSFEQQLESVTVLKATLDEAMIMISEPTPKQCAEFKIFILPYPSYLSRNFCSLYLHVKFTEHYPEVPPLLRLIDAVNISADNINHIRNKVNYYMSEIATNNDQIVFEVVQLIQQNLVEYNIEPLESSNLLRGNHLDESDDTSSNEEFEIQEQVKFELERRKMALKMHDQDFNQHADMKYIELELDRQAPEVPSHISGFDYHSYFQDETPLGEGGFGQVVKARNVIDGNFYAIKKVKQKGMKQANLYYILKEVVLLSRMNHENIVRYHHAWFEVDNDESYDDSEEESDSEYRSQLSFSVEQSFNKGDHDDWIIAFERSGGNIEPAIIYDQSSYYEKKILYIQMEYCAGDTLRNILDTQLPSIEDRWRLFREILASLNYIHSRGMIHRDLKPSNIFLTSEGTVKIGDFGLATTMNPPQREEIQQSNRSMEEHSSNVIGTYLYCSPEQYEGARYNHKTDMYALGIIFFEMWRQFNTASQRKMEIVQLKKDHVLPEDFVYSTPTEVVQIIMNLTQEQPGPRFSSSELLNSDLLPHSIDLQVFNEFLHVVLNPKTMESSRLMMELFQREQNWYLDYSYNLSKGIMQGSTDQHRRKRKIESIVKSSIRQRIRKVFELFGAVQVEIPLLYPLNKEFTALVQDRQGNIRKEKFASQFNTFKTIEPSGLIVQLPDNIVVPWARYIANQRLGGLLKRYAITKSFWALGAGEHPSENEEASFDICFDQVENNIANQLEAEVLKLTHECLSLFNNQFTKIDITINDTRILDAILDHAQIPMKTRVSVLKICQNASNKLQTVRKDLEELGLHFGAFGKLANYLKIQGSLAEVIDNLRKQSVRGDRVLMSVLQGDLKRMEEVAKIYGLTLKVDLGLVPENLLFYSGLIFKFTGIPRYADEKNDERITLAVGGRYDNLLAHYQFQKDIEQKHGICTIIHLERLFSTVASLQSIEWVKGPTVFIASQQNHDQLLKDRILFACDLWKQGISANYMYNQLNIEEVFEVCRRYRIRMLVILRYVVSGDSVEPVLMAKIRDFAFKNSEQQEERKNAIGYIVEKVARMRDEHINLTYNQRSNMTRLYDQ